MEEDKVKIGLEIHGYLTTREKLFCRCSTEYKESEVNTNICPICTAQPGCKPMLPNNEALKKVIAISLMLGCKINEKIIWQRKHYDWPDLPKGYQDTTSGAYSIPVGIGGNFLGIRIRHCHIEEDPSRWDPETGNIDYNRCGMPLIEIVTEPDFKTSKQVREWLKQMLVLLSYIAAVNENAGIKADVNVSVGQERVEIKNVNSIYSIERAIDYEILRQKDLIEKGEKIKRETRTFSDLQKVTISMRSKEEEADYRYIPDPDLPIIEIDKKLVQEIEKNLPESPDTKIKRFVKQYNLTEYDSKVLSSNLELAEFFEKIIKITKGIEKMAASWITIELLRVLNWNKKELKDIDVKPEHFAELLTLIHEKKMTELVAKQILNKFVPKSFSPTKGLEQTARIDDRHEIEEICKKVIKDNAKAVEDYKKGEEKSLHFLIGQVMKETKGRADNKISKELLLKLIK